VHRAMSTSIITMPDGPGRPQIVSSHNTLVTV
jgi:hypothetical protein